MSCLGVHFALTESDVGELRECVDEASRLRFLQEVLEERYFRESGQYIAESDKAWDAMHRALADGRLSWDGGDYPLNHAVLAGELLYTRPDYIMSLKTPEQVKDISKALADIEQSTFRDRYERIDVEDYGLSLTEEDLGFTWEWFENVRSLYDRAAAEGRYVLFTADQ